VQEDGAPAVIAITIVDDGRKRLTIVALAGGSRETDDVLMRARGGLANPSAQEPGGGADCT